MTLAKEVGKSRQLDGVDFLGGVAQDARVKPIYRCVCILLCCGAAFGQGTSSGGAFSLDGQITGGAGRSTGGAFEVIGNISFIGGTISTGGNFALRPGALDFFTLPLGDFELEISLSSGLVRILWPAEAVGYVLERTGAVGTGAAWQAVSPAPTGNSYTTQASGSAAFYRLQRP